MEIADLTARATSFIHRLQLHPEFYGEFKRAMRDYSTDKLNAAGVVSELDNLFKSHPDLLTDYRIFLSPRLRAALPPLCVSEPGLEILKSCINFMNKVQKRFAHKPDVIVECMETIRALTQSKICNKEACNVIVEIFYDGKSDDEDSDDDNIDDENQDLVDEFAFMVLGRKGIKRTKKKRKRKKNSSSPSNSSNSNSNTNSNSNSGDEIKARKQKTEDEMFELDINLSRRKKTVESANMLMDSLEQEQHQISNIDHYFSAVSLGYIMEVYREEGEYKQKGSSVITRLRKDPRSVLPEILEKLESKEEVLIKKWRDFHEKKKNPVTSHRCKLRSILCYYAV